MPNAWSNKDERQYEHQGQHAQTRHVRTSGRDAARTIKKHRREEGRTQAAQPAAHSPNRGLRNGAKTSCTTEQTTEIEGRSKMTKSELVEAVRSPQASCSREPSTERGRSEKPGGAFVLSVRRPALAVRVSWRRCATAGWEQAESFAKSSVEPTACVSGATSRPLAVGTGCLRSERWRGNGTAHARREARVSRD
jgi:hypothetical protein